MKMIPRPTKIMYLADYYESPRAGTEGQLLQLLQHHDASRYDPAITLLRGSDYVERNSLYCSTRILNIAKLASLGSIFKMIFFALNLRLEDYRLVHCFLNDVSVIAPAILRIFGIRVLVSRRDMGFWYTPLKLMALRCASLFVDRYVANSQAVAKVVQEMEWVPRRKISVIYNGILPRAGESVEDCTGDLAGVSEDTPVVGIVANLKPIKRIEVVIRAIADVSKHHPGVRLVIVGDDGPSQTGGSMREDLESVASRLGIREALIFTGGVDDPARYIDRFDVAVLCSESEGFSNALIEYMQAGRPIICTDTGGNPELIQDGVNGFLVSVGDVNALAERLIGLLADRKLARRMGDAARQTACSFSLERMIAEQMACYDDVLSDSGSSQQYKDASSAAI
jgi:glycosyltransferase involved in cell wall biosynthesis